MAQVLIRQKLLHGSVTNLVRADVLSEKNGVLRVKVEGQLHPVEVKASEVVRAKQVFGKTMVGQRSNTIMPKSFPTSSTALGNTLKNR